MLLEQLRSEVLDANLALVRYGLVLFTFGNVSGISRAEGLVAIKPSGVPYDQMTAERIVVTDLDGRVVDGTLRPSSDLKTHLELYRRFPTIGGVAHSHSSAASAWAQAQRPIPCFGTTHADYFHGPVPVTEPLSQAEIARDYEHETGVAIARTFANGKLDPDHYPGVLVAGHGPFTWGANATAAAEHAAILEYIASMASATIAINVQAAPLDQALHDKHFLRKHGPSAYYGQTVPLRASSK
jgi:L-ribulose-5-phosphate 4-epimerase